MRAAWDANAAFWDEQMESGGTWQQFLIEPAVERALRLEQGERVLEVACGNGEFARRMAELGAVARGVRAAVGKMSGNAAAWFDAYVAQNGSGWFRLDPAA